MTSEDLEVPSVHTKVEELERERASLMSRAKSRIGLGSAVLTGAVIHAAAFESPTRRLVDFLLGEGVGLIAVFGIGSGIYWWLRARRIDDEIDDALKLAETESHSAPDSRRVTA